MSDMNFDNQLITAQILISPTLPPFIYVCPKCLQGYIHEDIHKIVENGWKEFKCKSCEETLRLDLLIDMLEMGKVAMEQLMKNVLLTEVSPIGSC